MMIRFICDGVITEMNNFYDNNTDAELLLFYYLKMDAIKSGTDNGIGKLLGL